MESADPHQKRRERSVEQALIFGSSHNRTNDAKLELRRSFFNSRRHRGGEAGQKKPPPFLFRDLLVLPSNVGRMVDRKGDPFFSFFSFFWWRRLIHSKGARTSAASTPIGPRARL
jgi:hypothetical protein